MPRRSLVLGLSALAAPALAQPALQPGEIHRLLHVSGIPASVDGDVPHRQWLLEGAEVASLPGGLRGCAPYQPVGSAPEGDSPAGVGFAPDGSWFVAAHRQSRNLLVYNADTRALIREIPLSGSPADLAVSADGRWAVTPNLHEDTASIVDLDAGVEVAVLPVGAGPITARITPDSSKALVGSMVGDDVAVIDLAGATELRRVAGLNFGTTLSANFETFAVSFACSNPLEIADNDTAVFPDLFNDRIAFVDIDTGAVSFIAADDAPRNIALSADGSVAVVTHSFGVDDTVWVLDVAGQTVTRTIDVGTDLWGPACINGAETKAAVAVQNAVRIVDLTTGAVGSNLNTASVNALLTTADGQHALGVGFRGPLISFTSGTVVKELNNVISTSLGAASPADPRAVMLATTFGEDMVVVNTNGASGFLEEMRPSGPPPEGDKPRTIAVTPNGSRVLTTNQFSKNVSVFQSGSMQQTALIDAGLRPGQIKITPDGSTAVVTNRDDTFLTVIDLGTLDADEVTISTRGDQVQVSPDSRYAYVAVVVDDGVWRVNLDTLAVEGAKLPTGQMGGVAYTGNQFSGLALSNDGDTLVACNSYDNTITVIDAAAWAVVATVAVGGFPTTATFSPDDSRIYVTNRDGDSVSVVSNAGGGSSELGRITVGDYPYLSVTNADGTRLYVLNTADEAIGVVDPFLFSMIDTIPLDATPVGLVMDDAQSRLLVAIGTASASTNGDTSQMGQLAIIDTATNTVAETICADHFLSDLGASADRSMLAAPGLGGESCVFFDLDPCPPDLNGDGAVNTQDFILFLNLWSADDPQADWNGDGAINTQDFIAFLNDWVVGC